MGENGSPFPKHRSTFSEVKGTNQIEVVHFKMETIPSHQSNLWPHQVQHPSTGCFLLQPSIVLFLLPLGCFSNEEKSWRLTAFQPPQPNYKLPCQQLQEPFP